MTVAPGPVLTGIWKCEKPRIYCIRLQLQKDLTRAEDRLLLAGTGRGAAAACDAWHMPMTGKSIIPPPAVIIEQGRVTTTGESISVYMN